MAKLRSDGWILVATKGSHRQFKHLDKKGRVTVPGKPSDDLAPGTLKSILKQASLKDRVLMRYAIVIEKAENNFSAYVPDLPGCVATGTTIEETESEMRAAIEFHLQGMKDDGLTILEPASQVEYIEIAA